MNKDFEMVDKYIKYIRRIGCKIDIYKGYNEEHFNALENQIQKFSIKKNNPSVPLTYKYFLETYGCIEFAPVQIIGFGPDVLKSEPTETINGREISNSAVGEHADELWHSDILPLPRNFLPVIIDDEWYHCIDLSQPDEHGECPVFLVDFDGSIDDEDSSNSNSFGEFLRKQFEEDFLPRAMKKAGKVKDYDEYVELFESGRIDFNK